MAATRTRLIRIGNSQGIRIPKRLVDRAGLCGEEEIEAGEGQLIVRPAHKPSGGWDTWLMGYLFRGDGQE